MGVNRFKRSLEYRRSRERKLKERKREEHIAKKNRFINDNYHQHFHYLEAIPIDIIKVIISFSPYRQWLLLNKNISKIAKEIIDPNLHRYGNPLVWSVNERNIECVKSLLNNPKFNPSEHLNLAFKIAVEYETEDIVKLLLDDTRVDPSGGGNYCIQQAVKTGCTPIIKLLLQHPKVNPSVFGGRCIKTASAQNDVETAELLLKDIRVLEDQRALQVAMSIANKRENPEVYNLLHDAYTRHWGKYR